MSYPIELPIQQQTFLGEIEVLKATHVFLQGCTPEAVLEVVGEGVLDGGEL
jgi:hypothetical protein